MKKFLRIVLAVVCGTILVNLVTILILVAVATPSSEPEAKIVPGSVLKLDLSKVTIAEQGEETLSFGQQEDKAVIGLRKAVKALQAAAQDPSVKFLYVKPDGASMGLATAYEFRAAISEFRACGKPVIAFTENPTTLSYYMASAADKVYMSSYQGGNPMFIGVSSQLIFLKDLLDKFGVNVQLIRHGKFKSAGEMYIRSSSSPENRLQNQEMISSIWACVSSQIAESRGLSTEELNALVDNLSLCLPQDFEQAGLVDGLLSRGELEEKLSVLAGAASYEKTNIVKFASYVDSKVKDNYRSGKRIAVIYANGNIVDGLDMRNVDGDRFASMIEKVRRDSSVKAVVLRVNSPGGSVVASEKIRHELDRLAEVKPYVASYGNYAASGGYWISNAASKIFTCPTTLTGSIGVFGMVPDFSKTAKDIAHVGVEAVKSNKHSDMFGLMRPFTAEETAFMQRSIEAVYTKFVGLVADGRDMTPQDVDDIAQGRVWTGSDALRIGLVDEIGTLQDAIAWAAASAGDAQVSNWNIVEYPSEQTLSDMITAMFSGLSSQDYDVNIYKKWYDSWANGKHEYIFAQMPYQVDVR